MFSGYEVVEMFEQSCAEYLGPKYLVALSSCTAALKLAVQWCLKERSPRHGIGVTCPARTYVSVPMAIMNAGGHPHFREFDWLGAYQLEPLPVWDSARLFTSRMYVRGRFICHSFHATKTLGDMAGGCIAHDNPEADEWFRRMRFHGARMACGCGNGRCVGLTCRWSIRRASVPILAYLWQHPWLWE